MAAATAPPDFELGSGFPSAGVRGARMGEALRRLLGEEGLCTSAGDVAELQQALHELESEGWAAGPGPEEAEDDA